VKSIDKGGAVFAWIKTDILDYNGGIVNRGGVNDPDDDFGLWVVQRQRRRLVQLPDNRRRLSSKGLIPSGKWTLVGLPGTTAAPRSTSTARKEAWSR
jgi:hypothetical protein